MLIFLYIIVHTDNQNRANRIKIQKKKMFTNKIKCNCFVKVKEKEKVKENVFPFILKMTMLRCCIIIASTVFRSQTTNNACVAISRKYINMCMCNPVSFNNYDCHEKL